MQSVTYPKPTTFNISKDKISIFVFLIGSILSLFILTVTIGNIIMTHRHFSVMRSHFRLENVHIDVPTEFMSSIPNVEIRHFEDRNTLTFRVIDGFTEENMYIYYNAIFDAIIRLMTDTNGFNVQTNYESSEDCAWGNSFFHGEDYTPEDLFLFNQLMISHGITYGYTPNSFDGTRQLLHMGIIGVAAAVIFAGASMLIIRRRLNLKSTAELQCKR